MKFGKKYIVEYGPKGLNKAYKFGYEKDNPSFEYLRYKILGEKNPGSISESFYTLNLQNAKNYFDTKIQQLFDDKGFGEIKSLYLKLVNKIIFNIHYIDDDFDVFYPEHILKTNEKKALRRKVNETWIEVYGQLGRNKNNPLDDDEFLRNHWTIFFKYTRNQGDDYIQFLLNSQFTPKAIYGKRAQLVYSKIDENNDEEIDAYEMDDVLVPEEIIDYVDSLKDLAKYWYYSFNPSDNKDLINEEVKWINKLNHIGTNYFRTLIVTSLWSTHVTSNQRIKLYKTIEKFIFLYFRLAKYNASYNSANSYKYASKLYKNEVSIDEIIFF